MLVPLLLAAGLSINHQPADCFLKDRFPRLELSAEPAMGVSSVRVFFKSAREDEYHFVPMSYTMGRFLAKLPKPREKAGTVTYYIEVIAADGTNRKTPEITAQVVKAAEACPSGGRVADVGEDGDVKVWGLGSSRSRPKEFAGIGKVFSEREAAGEAAAPAGAETASAPASSAPPAAPSPAASASPAPFPSPSPSPWAAEETGEYQIGPEDILKVNVLGHEDLTQIIVVQSDGTFVFPLIGRVKAADLTPKELERKLTTLLGQGYIRNPQVTVAVQEYRSKTVFVVGEVSRPGSYSLGARMTVLELLSKAGPTSGAGAEVVIVRPKGPVQGPLVPVDLTGGVGGDTSEAAKQADLIRVNIRDIQMGQLDKNVLVHPNDTVFVSPAAKVFVTGEVRSPGAITYWPGATVRMVINTAGGFSADAASGRIRVVRQVEGKTKETKIAIDDPVQPGDTIIVKAKLF